MTVNMMITACTPKKVAIVQSNYIPWKGYFDLINMVDEFILYDDMQYTRRDWRNRNLIKTPRGTEWLTIPVEVKGKYYQAIKDTRISDTGWGKKHFAAIAHNYAKAGYFRDHKEFIEHLYLESSETYLSDINYRFIRAICDQLGIATKISWSSEYRLVEGKSERLLDLCMQARAGNYLSGPAAEDYIDETLFRQNGIRLEWMDYSGYPEYTQLHPPFVHGVTILDLLLNEGPHARNFLKSCQEGISHRHGINEKDGKASKN